MSLSPCWKPDARQVSNTAFSLPPMLELQGGAITANTEKNKKKLLLMLLDFFFFSFKEEMLPYATSLTPLVLSPLSGIFRKHVLPEFRMCQGPGYLDIILQS